jgi:hypothetical protein
VVVDDHPIGRMGVRGALACDAVAYLLVQFGFSYRRSLELVREALLDRVSCCGARRRPVAISGSA